MACPVSQLEHDNRAHGSDRATVAVRLLRGAMEALVVALVCLSPWPLGSVEPLHEFALYGALALLLALWGLRAIVEGQFLWQKCPVALCLAGLFLLAVWQTVPLPQGLLATLSPATKQVYERLLPAEPEVLSDEELGQTSHPPAGTTLSLYPGVTRLELVRLLAVFLLFAVVRNNVVSVAALRRLSIVALVNGTLLTLLGVAQFCTSPPNTLYWSTTVPNAVFGPFVCRNHFAFYINLCAGLGVGLLLSLLPVHPAWKRREYDGPDASAGGRLLQAGRRLLAQLTAHPGSLWVASALGLVCCGTLLSLSRGGLLAVAGAATLCLGLRLARSWRPEAVAAQLAAGSLAALLALALAAALGFGFDPLVHRLATLQGDQALQESRGKLWARVLPLAVQYPLWGTGYGTFQYVEPLGRTRGEDALFVYENAHNDYLEALVEGGVPRLLLSLLAIGLVSRAAVRALRRGGTPAGGLVWGALFAFLTVLIHSFGDFGLHLPAIAVLVTVLCAHLCALGDQAPGPSSGPADTVRRGGAIPWAAAATALALGLALAGFGWEAYHGASLRRAAAALRGNEEPERRLQRLSYLREAARRQADLASVHVELAQAYAELFDDASARQKEANQLRAMAQLVADSAAAPGQGAALSWVAASVLRAAGAEAQEAELARAHLLPALRAFVQARGACPLRTEPHLALATHVRLLRQAEPRATHLGRAKYLAPADPQVWYLCGLQELLEEPEQALASWRRSLELSDRYLPDILTRVQLSDADEVLNLLLPDRPALLLAAAFHLYPEPAAAAERRPLLTRGMLLLEGQAAPLGAEEYRVKADLCVALDRKADAVAAYQQALAREPSRRAWRYERARLLLECGQAREARRELLVILTQQPRDAAAAELLQAVARFLAERG